MPTATFFEPIGLSPFPSTLVVLDPPHLPLPENPSDDEAGNDQDDHLDEMPMTDESGWEVFIPDELERDPLPEPGDFWPDADLPWN